MTLYLFVAVTWSHIFKYDFFVYYLNILVNLLTLDKPKRLSCESL